MKRGWKSAKEMARARKDLDLAKKHLARVQKAWDEPTDWSDLTMYGLYCVEAAILAASTTAGWQVKKTHWDKEKIAERLHAEHDLPDVAELLRVLNSGRKASAYGDEEFDVQEHDPEDIANEIEEFVNAVEAFLGSHE